MLVKGIMTQMSGSLGGITGSHNRGGLYLRARSIPVDPGSIRQQVMRSAVALLTSRWRDELSPEQRQAWETYAENTPLPNPLGDQRNVGGLAMYIRGNAMRVQIDELIIDDPISSGLPTLSPPDDITLSATSGQLTVTVADDPWVSADDFFLGVYASRPLPASINFFKGPYRLIGSLAGNSTTPPTQFGGSYSDQWGSVSEGDQVRIQLRVASSVGTLSFAVRDFVIAGV